LYTKQIKERKDEEGGKKGRNENQEYTTKLKER